MTNSGMPSWEEWNEQLTEEQRKYSLYKILSDLYHKECSRDVLCEKRLERIQRLERRKWFDRGIATAVGIGTGIATALGIKIGA